MFGSSSSGRHNDTRWWGDYVVTSLLEGAADQVLEKQRVKGGGAGDRLYSFDSFRKDFGTAVGTETPLTEVDAKVLLRYLERDRKVIVFDKEVIKFIADNVSPHEISAIDRGILELKNAVQGLHAQVDGLQNKVDECTRKASAALRQKRKPVALNYLRSRKELEELLSKRLGSLHTLESTLIHVEAAAGDIEIMKSFESSTATLRTLLAHPSLQRESIEATMDALAEVNADAKEFDEAIRIGGGLATNTEDVIDEDDLEDELRGLIEEVKRENVVADDERDIASIRAKLHGKEMQVPNEILRTEDKGGARVVLSTS